MGTGGYFGEKPWRAAGDRAEDGSALNHRVDLVAKVSKVQRPGNYPFFPVKLGDYKKGGEWHFERPGKFAVSPELLNCGLDGEVDQIFKRFQRHGTWAQRRFDELWEQYCFTGDK